MCALLKTLLSSPDSRGVLKLSFVLFYFQRLNNGSGIWTMLESSKLSVVFFIRRNVIVCELFCCFLYINQSINHVPSPQWKLAAIDFQHSLSVVLFMYSDMLLFVDLLKLSAHLYRCRLLACLPYISHCSMVFRRGVMELMLFKVREIFHLSTFFFHFCHYLSFNSKPFSGPMHLIDLWFDIFFSISRSPMS